MLSGRGGDTESVLRVRGGGVVTIRNLDFIEGDDQPEGGSGGGIDYEGRGTLNLENVRFYKNKASYGGGLHFTSSGGRAVLGIGNRVAFHENSADENGGAMHVSGDTVMHMYGSLNEVRQNTAGERGGGLYVRAPAVAHVSPGGIPGSAVFAFNRADKGGAIAVNGAYGTGHVVGDLNLGSVAVEPVSFWNNSARTAGGALYMTPIRSVGGNTSSSIVRINRADFRYNRAPQGAAIWAARDVDGLGIALHQVWYVNQPSADTPVPCNNPPCVRFVHNFARHDDGRASGGGVVEADAISAPRTLSYFYAAYGEGEAGALFRFRGIVGGVAMQISNCLIDGSASAHVINSGEGEVDIRHCTILQRPSPGAPLPMLRLQGNSSISNSILAGAPGVQILQRTGTASGFLLDQVLASDTSSLPPGMGVVQGDPRFVDIDFHNGDIVHGFSLRSDSPAIDRGPTLDDGVSWDMARRERTKDLYHPNGAGPRDLGALELQSAVPPVDPPDPPPQPHVFRDSFEKAPTRKAGAGWCNAGRAGCDFPWMSSASTPGQ